MKPEPRDVILMDMTEYVLPDDMMIPMIEDGLVSHNPPRIGATMVWVPVPGCEQEIRDRIWGS